MTGQKIHMYSNLTLFASSTPSAVAIKVVDKMCARFDESLLQSEISTMMQCDHPNCVTLFQVPGRANVAPVGGFSLYT